MITAGVISLEPSQEIPPKGAANVSFEMRTLKPEPDTSSNVNEPSSPVEALWTLLPPASIRLTLTPGSPSSCGSTFPGPAPPGLKSRQTTPVIAPGFGCGVAACFAPDGTSSGGIAVRPRRAVPPAGIGLCRVYPLCGVPVRFAVDGDAVDSAPAG